MASEFKFNNKNLNSLGALVCQLDQESKTSKQLIRVNSISVNQKRIGPEPKDIIIEVQGTCNKIVSPKSMKVTALGDEFFVKFDRSLNHAGKGKIGIKNISIRFNAGKIKNILIEDPLLMTKITKDLSHSTWASTNQIFSFSADKMALKFSRKIAATETGGTLEFESTRYFNVWSDQAYGCSQVTNEISDLACEKLIKL